MAASFEHVLYHARIDAAAESTLHSPEPYRRRIGRNGRQLRPFELSSMERTPARSGTASRRYQRPKLEAEPRVTWGLLGKAKPFRTYERHSRRFNRLSGSNGSTLQKTARLSQSSVLITRDGRTQARRSLLPFRGRMHFRRFPGVPIAKPRCTPGYYLCPFQGQESERHGQESERHGQESERPIDFGNEFVKSRTPFKEYSPLSPPEAPIRSARSRIGPS